MTPELTSEIIDSLPSGRTLFPYYRDRYALELLRAAFPHGESIPCIKRSPFGRLLQKPVARELLSQIGRKQLIPNDFDSCWPQDYETYRLTLGHWPGSGEKWSRQFHQTTRRGTNLVLRLNFAVSHNRELQRITHTDIEGYNDWSIHPIEKTRNLTLAWSRIDLDFDTGEALIEEIQTDWVRDARTWAEESDSSEHASRFRKYRDTVMNAHYPIWDEAMLCATLRFLTEEIGIRSIFYHTADSGRLLKFIDWSHPPRSIYTDLPRRFCFQTTCNGPLFVRDRSDRHVRRLIQRPETKWFHLELPHGSDLPLAA